MKFKKIVGFGDSWIWGDELLDPSLQDYPNASAALVENISYREHNCFLGQLGKHYMVPTENFGIPGGSLQSTIWKYIWWVENSVDKISDCLIIVGLTDSKRNSFYNPKINDCQPENSYVHTSIVHNSDRYSDEWKELTKQLTVLTSCNKLDKLNYQQAVMFFDGQCSLYFGNLLQVCTISPPCVVNANSLIDPNSSLVNFINQQHRSNELLALNRHPNELGHQMISKYLINWIDSCIIKG